ncbi:hypothetical protein BDZ89DRAFT_1070697 [Hymenopellis radicata]|nr:hypothetical protein BDZ89DRAFT_1070697 [Hymenopellis radicata]
MALIPQKSVRRRPSTSNGGDHPTTIDVHGLTPRQSVYSRTITVLGIPGFPDTLHTYSSLNSLKYLPSSTRLLPVPS